MRPLLPRREAARLASLRALEIIGTDPDPGIDAICRAARHLFGVPIVLVSLVEENEQWFKARCGLAVEKTPRAVSFCAHAILEDGVFVVKDARSDPRFADNPLVTGEPFIRAYAGAPIALEPGLHLGTLCIADSAARRFEDEDLVALRDMAESVAALIRLHKARLEARREAETLARSEAMVEAQRAELAERKARLKTTLENIDQGILMVDGRGVVQVFNERTCTLLDLPAAMLAEQPNIAEVIERQVAAGDFPGATAEFVEMVKRAGLDGRPGTYERVRSNGTVVEVRVTPLPDGGSVRTYSDVTAARRVLDALRDNEERLALALDATRDGIWDIDLVSGARVTKGHCYTLLDLPEGPTYLPDLFSIVHPDDRARVEAELGRHLAGETDLLIVEYRLRLKSGGYMWVLDRGRVVARDAHGRALRILGTQTDVTERKRTEEAMRILNERLELALSASGVGLWDWNIRTDEVWRCRRWHDLIGHADEEIANAPDAWRSRVHPEDIAEVDRIRDAHLRGETDAIDYEYRLRHADGSYRWIASRARIVEWDGQEPTRILGVHSDVTARKEAERHAAHFARHDALTDLPNRLLLDERLEQALSHAARHGGEVGVLCLDLDRFKSVNDTLGHAAGDTVLVEVGRRLRDLVRTEDTVARLGGDEFAIVQIGGPGEVDCEALARRIVRALSQPIALAERDVVVGTSVGIARAPRDGTSRRDLLVRADTALYRAKVDRNTFRFFEPSMDRLAAERRALELDLRKAVDANELVVHYQPILDLATRAIVAREALVRWNHPVRGLVGPGEFIPVAEEIGMIDAIGRAVLERACADAAAWPEPMRIAVNISPIQFRQRDFVENVVATLECAGLPPGRLELEITESALVEDGATTLATFGRLRALGVRIALDDFGTGYSSLGYLSRYPFDKIKIDRAFIRAIDEGDNAAIVGAIVELGRRRGSDVVAEGIEDERQLAAAAALGCTQGQGFLFGRPEPLGAHVGPEA